MHAVLTTLVMALAAENPYLERGSELFNAMHYEAAAKALELAAQAPTSTREERLLVLNLLGRAQAAQGLSAEAESSFTRLLMLDASAPSPEGESPKIRALFQRAKQRLFPAGFVGLKRAPSLENRLSIEVVDPWGRVGSLALVGQSGRRALKLKDSQATVELSEAEQRAPEAIEAADLEGKVVARLELLPRSSPAAPSLPVTSRPLPVMAPRARWPIWTVAALSGAALIGGGGLAIASSGSSASAGRAQFTSDIRSLDARAREEAIYANVLVGSGVLGLATAAGLALFW